MTADIAATRQGVKLTRQTMPYLIIERLSELYSEAHAESEPDAFKQDHFASMMEDLSLSATRMEQSLYDGMEGDGVHYIDLMRLSCAYCVEAIRAEKQSRNNDAWIFSSFAQYWLGIANGIRFVSGAAELAFVSKGKVGGQNKDEENYAKARQRAIELAKNYLEWSAASAARQVKDAVDEFQRNNNKEHFIPNVATIAGWLRESGLVFGTKRLPRRTNTKS